MRVSWKSVGLLATALVALPVLISGRGPGKEPEPINLKITEHVAFESSYRTVGVRRDRQGNYYVLNMGDRLVWRYMPGFVPSGRIGGIGQALVDLQMPEDLAITPDGKVVVADYGANAVKIYQPTGVLYSSFEFWRPRTVGTLSTGEILVSGFPREGLIAVFNQDGELLRTIGQLIAVDDSEQLNTLMNVGNIVVDASDNIYYAFSFLPDPTIRKYNRDGELVAELHPDGERLREASARAREKLEEDRKTGGLGATVVIDSLAVDDRNEELWISCSDAVYRYGLDGKQKVVYSFRIPPENFRSNADHILVEEDRLIITSWLHGVFTAAKPGERENLGPRR